MIGYNIRFFYEDNVPGARRFLNSPKIHLEWASVCVAKYDVFHMKIRRFLGPVDF